MKSYMPTSLVRLVALINGSRTRHPASGDTWQMMVISPETSLSVAPGGASYVMFRDTSSASAASSSFVSWSMSVGRIIATASVCSPRLRRYESNSYGSAGATSSATPSTVVGSRWCASSLSPGSLCDTETTTLGTSVMRPPMNLYPARTPTTPGYCSRLLRLFRTASTAGTSSCGILPTAEGRPTGLVVGRPLLPSSRAALLSSIRILSPRAST